MKPQKLITSNITDPGALLNFERLNNFISTHPFARLSGEFREFKVIALTDQKVVHNLPFTPKDVIILHSSDYTAVVSFNYAKFDETFLYVKSDKATTLRIIVGRYE